MAGFRYFDCSGVKRISIRVRGYAGGRFEVRNTWDGDVLGCIETYNSNNWQKYTAEIAFPDGKQSIYFTYTGSGVPDLRSFAF